MAHVWTIVATFACLAALMAVVAGAAIATRSEPLISQSQVVSPR
jgi:hypothetical protein